MNFSFEAFLAEFGTDPSVQLRIHSRSGLKNDFDLQTLKNKINRRKEIIKLEKLSFGKNQLTRNVEILLSSLPGSEYKSFLQSLDCYVLLSRGEGFSLTPREALALGKPCIITNNTAHQTIAKTGFVYVVQSRLPEPASTSTLDSAVITLIAN